MKILPQDKFPLLKLFKEVLPVTERTVFAYDEIIYSNYDLPMDIVIHEERHHAQQKKYGLKEWVDNYLKDPKYRLEMELDAYRHQIRSIENKELQRIVRQESAKHLASSLYGNLVDFNKAYKLLKI